MAADTKTEASLPHDLAVPQLLDSLADGAYLTDVNRKILFWNRAAEQITGWQRADVVSKSCFDNIMAHKDKDGHPLCGQEHCPLHRSIVTRQPSTKPLLIFAKCQSGARIPVEVSVAPLRNHHGEVIGGIEVFRDLSEAARDMLRAKDIQETALKIPLPQDDRLELEIDYEPRDLVGGDFYRIERRDEDHYALLVADTLGHGVAAGLYTMELRVLWDEHWRSSQSPAHLLSVINEHLHPLVGDTAYFATAVCVAYDAATGLLSCARAGHPSPLLVRKSGGIESVGTSQPALGLFADCSYDETHLTLDKGDTLLLFTDGAIELFDRSGQQLGVEGLKQLVLAPQVGRADAGLCLAALQEQLLRVCDQATLPDDLTLVKLRRTRDGRLFQ